MKSKKGNLINSVTIVYLLILLVKFYIKNILTFWNLVGIFVFTYFFFTGTWGYFGDRISSWGFKFDKKASRALGLITVIVCLIFLLLALMM